MTCFLPLYNRPQYVKRSTEEPHPNAPPNVIRRWLGSRESSLSTPLSPPPPTPSGRSGRAPGRRSQWRGRGGWSQGNLDSFRSRHVRAGLSQKGLPSLFAGFRTGPLKQEIDTALVQVEGLLRMGLHNIQKAYRRVGNRFF